MAEVGTEEVTVGEEVVDPLLAGLLDGSIPLEAATPDQLEQLAAMGALGDQLAMADALSVGPEGRDTGNMYVAANPLEHIGSAMAARSRKGILDKQTEGRELSMQMIVDALKKRGGPEPEGLSSAQELAIEGKKQRRLVST